MQQTLTVNSNFNSLDTLFDSLKQGAAFEASKNYDVWDHRVNDSGQIEQCIVLKKSSMHAVKIHFIGENKISLRHIIPNKLMNAYFGESQKARKDIFELIGGAIKKSILAGGQQKAFDEIVGEVDKLLG